MTAKAPRTALLAALLGLVGAGEARAWDDLAWRTAAHELRVAQQPVFLGAGDRGYRGLALRLGPAASPLAPSREGPARQEPLERLLAPERRSLAQPELLVVSGTGQGGLALGDRSPERLAGDVEDGLVSARVGGEARVGWRGLSAVLEPELGLDALGLPGGETVGLGASRLREAWLGLHTARWEVGFGLRERWYGPGRRGTLLLGNHAASLPLGTAAWTGRLPWQLGHARLEAGAGWLPGERGDVQRPGLLLMDLRYLPIPELELGATRMGLFGGEGRPLPPLGQLLLPTQPHVYDDPDKLEPDQDELASLDLRLGLPLWRWLGREGGVVPERVELWWQYGAEDVIARRFSGIPYPSLAGVGNLLGLELASGDWSLVLEGHRLLDDYFRWYTGHRVYHEGFVHQGLPLGHPAGGDSLGLAVQISWLAGPRGAELWAEQVRRVGIVEASGDNLLALSTDERTWRIGLGGWLFRGDGWWRLQAEVERTTGVAFVPGEAEWAGRLALSRRALLLGR